MPQEEKYPINKWAFDDRPREKLRKMGAGYLTDTELLAILIGNGTRNRTAIDLAREALRLAQNNLYLLGKQSFKDYMKIHGIGEVKAIQLEAALELGRRRQLSKNPEKLVITDSASVARILKARFGELSHEVFVVVFLNRANKINHIEVISSGGITGTIADPRMILKKAVMEEAVSLILCHNHPSGNLKPSRADEELTIKIREAAKYFDIRVLDHLIVSEEGYFSFADEGLI